MGRQLRIINLVGNHELRLVIKCIKYGVGQRVATVS